MSDFELIFKFGPSVIGQLKGIEDVEDIMYFLKGFTGLDDFGLMVDGILYVTGDIKSPKVVFVHSPGNMEFIFPSDITENRDAIEKGGRPLDTSDSARAYLSTGILLRSLHKRADQQSTSLIVRGMYGRKPDEEVSKEPRKEFKGNAKERQASATAAAKEIGRTVGAPKENRRKDLLALPSNLTSNERFAKYKRIKPGVIAKAEQGTSLPSSSAEAKPMPSSEVIPLTTGSNIGIINTTEKPSEIPTPTPPVQKEVKKEDKETTRENISKPTQPFKRNKIKVDGAELERLSKAAQSARANSTQPPASEQMSVTLENIDDAKGEEW